MIKPIYLDYNATTPVDPRVAEAMQPFLTEHFGNPSSSHYFGAVTKKAVESARKQVAGMLGAKIEEVIFTSGGSESNNYAIMGAMYANRDKGNHIITSAIEHPAVSEVCGHLESKGFNVTYLPVDEFGLVEPGSVEAAITPQTVLITIMHANNEVGTIQPINKIAAIAKKYGIIMHTDCAQSIGKTRVNVNELNVDLLSVAGHKLYAPKGIGALYIRTGVKLDKLIFGANHEMNRRAGTENVLEITGLGKACELLSNDLEKHFQHMKNTRDRLESKLSEKLGFIKINGHKEKRLPNTSSISFKSYEANTILAELKGVAASAGAACHADQIDVSSTLNAMNVPLEYAMGTVRFSTGRFTTIDEIDKAVEEIVKVVEKLNPASSAVSAEANDAEIKLTQFTHGLGCACKLRPQLLEEVLAKIPSHKDKNILVGTDTSDDAAVYLIDEKTAIVQTVDFFTPIVDDPFQFGAIAAANSLSDIYAMGAKPLFALNVVGFPSNRLPMSVLEEILKGAQSKAEEAGIAIIGGHTVDDTEPKFGLAATGIVDPKKIVTNKNARAGDVLVLTKPVGTGILSTALKNNLLDEYQQKMLISTMAELNNHAADTMQIAGVNACTDVTGFGLIGHLLEMMKGSCTTAEINISKIPLLQGTKELAVANVIPGGTRDNYEHTFQHTEYNSKVSEIDKLILNDAQTSGGLLVSMKATSAEKYIELLYGKSITAIVIGKVVSEGDAKIIVNL